MPNLNWRAVKKSMYLLSLLSCRSNLTYQIESFGQLADTTKHRSLFVLFVRLYGTMNNLNFVLEIAVE